MQSWANGAKGEEVKRIIDENFDFLEKSINQFAKVYVKDFTQADWGSGAGSIYIPFSEYNKETPFVELFIKNAKNQYSTVYGGYTVDKNGVLLQSDIPYEGRVVIR